MKLYIWHNAVFVLASSIDEARNLAAKRLHNLKSVNETVRQEQPLELEAPCVHLVFHAGAMIIYSYDSDNTRRREVFWPNGLVTPGTTQQDQDIEAVLPEDSDGK